MTRIFFLPSLLLFLENQLNVIRVIVEMHPLVLLTRTRNGYSYIHKDARFFSSTVMPFKGIFWMKFPKFHNLSDTNMDQIKFIFWDHSEVSKKDSCEIRNSNENNWFWLLVIRNILRSYCERAYCFEDHRTKNWFSFLKDSYSIRILFWRL